MGRRKQLRRFGKAIRKKKNIRRGLRIGGEVGQLAGQGLVLGGTATGQPEVVAAGGTLAGVGALSNKLAKSSLLRSRRRR